ncbi:MAG: hydrogenase maturation nickel metallochaperone HypA [Anaerolineae bacterium]|nr:hydrogenase maturation nickel metallochaperone HypA [Anaerolineae bacterium]
MHELAFTESVLNTALRYAEQADAERITEIHLSIGQLSSFVNDCVSFYWDIISKGTIAEGAQLCFERLPAIFECERCGHQYPLSESELVCPVCGSAHIQVISGDESKLVSIAVEP